MRQAGEDVARLTIGPGIKPDAKVAQAPAAGIRCRRADLAAHEDKRPLRRPPDDCLADPQLDLPPTAGSASETSRARAGRGASGGRAAAGGWCRL